MDIRICVLCSIAVMTGLFSSGNKATAQGVGCRFGYKGGACTTPCGCTGTGVTGGCNDVNGDCFCKAGYEGPTCTDIDECLQIPNPCSGAQETCSDTDGSFTCVCNTGYYQKHDRVCTECEAGKYGLNCDSDCTCNMANTDTCNNVDGTCTCKKEWSGANCDVDVNECATNGHDCIYSQEECNNKDGGYDCTCKAGYYYKHPRVCEECEAGKWGKNCTSVCQCNMANTETCDNVNGTCTACKKGWQGGNCDVDVDECANSGHDCIYSQEECTNKDGGYDCTCKAGYYYKHPRVCTECAEGKWGANCASNCTCVSKNTESCDHMTGSCTCKAGWEGTTCDVDLDECLTMCKGGNETCANTVGSYKCTCDKGYSRNSSNVCVDVDECADDSLNNCNHKCHNNVGGFACSCDLFYNLGDAGQCYASGLVEVIGLAVGIPIAIAIIIIIIVLCIRKNPQCCYRSIRDNDSVYTQGKRRVWTTHPYFKR